MTFTGKKDELGIGDGFLLWLERTIIPVNLTDRTLKALHAGYPGITAMRVVARYYVWWPHLDKGIEKSRAGSRKLR